MKENCRSLMTGMMPAQESVSKRKSIKRQNTSKMVAFKRMQELRQETKKYDIIDFDAERTAALEDKISRYWKY